MKVGWEPKPLGEVMRLEYGKPLPPEDRNPNGLYPVYGANGEKGRTDRFYKRQPSIIVGRKGSAGEITRTEDKYWPLDVTYYAEFDRQRYDLQFLYYLLMTLDLPSLAKGVKPGINRNEVCSIPVMVPPLSEQRRIVAILDEAFEGIATAKAHAEKNLRNARDLGFLLRDGLFSQIAAKLDRRRLGDVCTFVRGPFGGSLKKDCFVSDGYAVYEQSHAIHDQFSKIRYYVNEAKFKEMGRFELRPNDLIMSCSGTMGRVAVAPPDLKRGIINQALLKLTPNVIVEPLYLRFWMESRDFQDSLTQRSGGAAIQNVASVSVLKEIALPLPSRAEQRLAVDRLEQIAADTEGLCDSYEKKFVALDELKRSLLVQAFAGALPTKAVDEQIAEIA